MSSSGTKKSYYVTHDMVTSYLTCPRYYYYKYVRRFVRNELNIRFFVGNLVHDGVRRILRHDKTALTKFNKRFEKAVEDLRQEFPEITTKDEQELQIQETLIYGMLEAWKKKYAVFIRETKPKVDHEIKIEHDIGKNIIVVGYIDDLLVNKSKEYLFELKTARFIDPQYVRNLAVNLQKTLYFYVLRRSIAKRLNGIIYNVVVKPTIRQRQKETLQEFIKRLEEWYHDALRSEQRFYFYREKEPLLSESETLNTVHNVVERIRDSHYDQDRFYQNFNSCIRDWGRCEYFELCHEGGETKQNLQLYKPRKSRR